MGKEEYERAWIRNNSIVASSIKMMKWCYNVTVLKRTLVFKVILSFDSNSFLNWKVVMVSSISFCLSRSLRMHLKGREVQNEEDLYEMSKFSHRDKFSYFVSHRDRTKKTWSKKGWKTLISSLHFITNQLIFTRLQKKDPYFTTT